MASRYDTIPLMRADRKETYFDFHESSENTLLKDHGEDEHDKFLRKRPAATSCGCKLAIITGVVILVFFMVINVYYFFPYILNKSEEGSMVEGESMFGQDHDALIHVDGNTDEGRNTDQTTSDDDEDTNSSEENDEEESYNFQHSSSDDEYQQEASDNEQTGESDQSDGLDDLYSYIYDKSEDDDDTIDDSDDIFDDDGVNNDDDNTIDDSDDTDDNDNNDDNFDNENDNNFDDDNDGDFDDNDNVLGDTIDASDGGLDDIFDDSDDSFDDSMDDDDGNVDDDNADIGITNDDTQETNIQSEDVNIVNSKQAYLEEKNQSVHDKDNLKQVSGGNYPEPTSSLRGQVNKDNEAAKMEKNQPDKETKQEDTTEKDMSEQNDIIYVKSIPEKEEQLGYMSESQSPIIENHPTIAVNDNILNETSTVENYMDRQSDIFEQADDAEQYDSLNEMDSNNTDNDDKVSIDPEEKTNELPNDVDNYKWSSDSSDNVNPDIAYHSGLAALDSSNNTEALDSKSYNPHQDNCMDCLIAYNPSLLDYTGDKLVEAMLDLLKDTVIESKCHAYCDVFVKTQQQNSDDQ